jgi:hypothetical protein
MIDSNTHGFSNVIYQMKIDLMLHIIVLKIKNGVLSPREMRLFVGN